jgi:hypothetical protein
LGAGGGGCLEKVIVLHMFTTHALIRRCCCCTEGASLSSQVMCIQCIWKGPQKVRSRARNMVSRMSAKKARNTLDAALAAFLLYIVIVAVVVVEMRSL